MSQRPLSVSSDSALAGYVSETDLADELGLTKRTLIRWRRLREGPAATRVGRRIYYSRAAVGRWLSSHEQNGG